MKRNLLITGLAIILVLSALSATACSTSKPGTVGWEVPIDNFMNKPNHSDQIEVPVGDTLILKMGSNPTTGFSWSENADIDDSSILKQLSHEFIEPDTEMVGAAGQEVWTFEAMKKGTTKVSMEYSRPWEGGEKGEWIYEIEVTVK